MLREEMLLQALAIESAAHMQRDEVLIQSAFASLFRAGKAGEMLQQLTFSTRRAHAMMGLNLNPMEAPKARGSVESMVKLYQALVKQGIIIENDLDAA